MPPDSRPAISSARPAAKWTTTDGLDPVRVRMLTNACQGLAESHGEPMRRREVRERVIRLMRGGYADVEQSFRRTFLGILDPTGESAAERSDRQRAAARMQRVAAIREAR